MATPDTVYHQYLSIYHKLIESDIIPHSKQSGIDGVSQSDEDPCSSPDN